MPPAKCASCQLIFSSRTWCFGNISAFTHKKRKKEKEIERFHASSERKGCCVSSVFPEITGNIWYSCVLQVFSSVTSCLLFVFLFFYA